jgi:hypothetical protein
MKTRKVKIILIIVLAILSGFARDYVMVNINWVIKHLTLGAPNYAQKLFNPLLNWNVSNLITLKWILTFVFTGYFFCLTYYSIKYIFNNNKLALTYVKGFYALLIIVSIIIYGFGYLTNSVNEIYTTVRTIMGIIQSFIPLMMLYLFIKFGNNLFVTNQ